MRKFIAPTVLIAVLLAGCGSSATDDYLDALEEHGMDISDSEALSIASDFCDSDPAGRDRILGQFFLVMSTDDGREVNDRLIAYCEDQ